MQRRGDSEDGMYIMGMVMKGHHFDLVVSPPTRLVRDESSLESRVAANRKALPRASERLLVDDIRVFLVLVRGDPHLRVTSVGTRYPAPLGPSETTIQPIRAIRHCGHTDPSSAREGGH
jgi:hypothetical protein